MTLEKVTRSFVFFVQLLELKAREKKRTKKKERSGRETQKKSPSRERKKKNRKKKRKKKCCALKIKKDTQNAHKLRAQRKRSFGKDEKTKTKTKKKRLFSRAFLGFFCFFLCVYIQTRSLSFKKKGGFILREREKNAPEKKDEEHEHY